MKVVLINQGHTDNLGDKAINEAIRAMLPKNWEVQSCPFDFYIFKQKNIITRVCNKILNLNHDVLVYFKRKKIQRMIKSQHFDAAIIGGGELLGSDYDQFCLDFDAWTKVLSSLSIPIYAIGLSGNSAKREWIFRHFKKSLARCKYISVRDKSTLELVRTDYGINNCEYFPDVVFSFRAGFVLESKDRDLLLCVPSRITHAPDSFSKLGISSVDEYYEYLYCNIVDLANKYSLTKIKLTTTTLEDRDTCEKLLKYCDSKDSKYIFLYEPCETLSNYIHILRDVRVILSGRMHACILGLIHGCEFQIVPYKEKLIVFSQEYDNCNIELIHEESKKSISKVVNLIENQK